VPVTLVLVLVIVVPVVDVVAVCVVPVSVSVVVDVSVVTVVCVDVVCVEVVVVGTKHSAAMSASVWPTCRQQQIRRRMSFLLVQSLRAEFVRQIPGSMIPVW